MGGHDPLRVLHVPDPHGVPAMLERVLLHVPDELLSRLHEVALPHRGGHVPFHRVHPVARLHRPELELVLPATVPLVQQPIPVGGIVFVVFRVRRVRPQGNHVEPLMGLHHALIHVGPRREPREAGIMRLRPAPETDPERVAVAQPAAGDGGVVVRLAPVEKHGHLVLRAHRGPAETQRVGFDVRVGAPRLHLRVDGGVHVLRVHPRLLVGADLVEIEPTGRAGRVPGVQDAADDALDVHPVGVAAHRLEHGGEFPFHHPGVLRCLQ